MLAIVGWVLFVIAAIWGFSSLKFSHTRRLNNRSYIIMLLLKDSIREDHKKKLTDFIKQSQAKDAMQLGYGVDFAVDDMSERLANNESGPSLLAAHAMTWKYKHEGKID